jgi:hypothetical protein
MIFSLEHTISIIFLFALEETGRSRLFIIPAGEISFCGTSEELRDQNKCDYTIRIDTINNHLELFLEFVKGYAKGMSILDERDDIILFPFDSGIPDLLTELENRKEELGVTS